MEPRPRYSGGMDTTASNAVFRRLVDSVDGIPEFARRTGRPRALVLQIYHGRRPVPPGWCESLCVAWPAVRPEQLRPDYVFLRGPDGRLYWRPR